MVYMGRREFKSDLQSKFTIDKTADAAAMGKYRKAVAVKVGVCDAFTDLTFGSIISKDLLMTIFRGSLDL